MSDQIVVGKLITAFGVKGWLKVQSFTRPEEALFAYKPWWLRDPDKNSPGKIPGKSLSKKELTPVELIEAKAHGKGFVACVKGCRDRSQALALSGKEIVIDRSQLPDLESGEHYWVDLVGLTVLDANGHCLGHVKHLMETGANDVLVVQGDANSIDRKERLIPYLPQIVMQVDLERSVMQVDWDKDF